MPPPRVLLVVGAAGSGKSALIQRYAKDAFPASTRPTIGLDMEAATVTITPSQAEDHNRLFKHLSHRGMELEIWELGGRELAKRELPRGRVVDGVMICYDIGDRASFQRASHILMNFLMDRHMAEVKNESAVSRHRDVPVGVNGAWNKGSISGDKLTWRDGQIAQIQLIGTGAKTIETKWNGRSYTGELKEDGKIHWSDGDIWSRNLVPRRQAIQLVGTKADDDSVFAVSSEEVQAFVRANNLGPPASTSAKTGDGVINAFFDLAATILEADREGIKSESSISTSSRLVAESWSLALPSQAGQNGPMTSPRGARPFEPARGAQQSMQQRAATVDTDRLVEALDQHGQATGTRTLGRCLERGLRHRAVHVWLIVPRTGAVLLRRYAPEASKHPGRWGPTVHGEILSYGSDGDGHAAELSAQAAERSIREQLGFDASEVGELEHWFSCSTQDGNSVEVVDVHVAALKGQGLPALQLRQGEEVDWAFFGDVFSEEAKRAGTVFKAEEEYVMALFRPLRARLVKNDVMNAFGKAALTTLEKDEARGFARAGGAMQNAGSSARGLREANRMHAPGGRMF